MITVSKNLPVFDKIKWVLQAVCKDSARANLCYLYVDSEKNRMVCTDGKWMLYATHDGLFSEPGFYRVVVNTVKEIILEHVDSDMSFPNVDLVMPLEIPFNGVEGNTSEYEVFGITPEEPSRYKGASKTDSVSHIMCHIIQRYTLPVAFDFMYIQMMLKFQLVDQVGLRNIENQEYKGGDTTWGTPDPNAPLFFSGHEVSGAVMPLRA